MPFKNKVIKLNSINRKPVGKQSCIMLDTQQDWRSYVHSLALVPAIKKSKPDGSDVVSFPKGKLQLIASKKAGLFPICFKMRDRLMVREWIDTNIDWVQNHGIVIYA